MAKLWATPIELTGGDQCCEFREALAIVEASKTMTTKAHKVKHGPLGMYVILFPNLEALISREPREPRQI